MFETFIISVFENLIFNIFGKFYQKYEVLRLVKNSVFTL